MGLLALLCATTLCSATLVVVVLDEQQQALLAEDANGTNMHSLRALWAQKGDFWDIEVQHDCTTPCTFSPDQSRIPDADAVLISAQVTSTFARPHVPQPLLLTMLCRYFHPSGSSNVYSGLFARSRAPFFGKRPPQPALEDDLRPRPQRPQAAGGAL
jgi:hypothetical protein